MPVSTPEKLVIRTIAGPADPTLGGLFDYSCEIWHSFFFVVVVEPSLFVVVVVVVEQPASVFPPLTSSSSLIVISRIAILLLVGAYPALAGHDAHASFRSEHAPQTALRRSSPCLLFDCRNSNPAM